MNSPYQVIIAGAGGIGRAVALLLVNYPDFGGAIYIGDRHLQIAEEAAAWVRDGQNHPVDITPFTLTENGNDEALHSIAAPGDVLLDCLPGSQAPRLARIALEHQMHYVNLTEYVEETRQIEEMAADASSGFVLQTGLAPGFVNIAAHGLYQQFVAQYDNPVVERIVMRVGALTAHCESPHFYGFTWSPIGVATEYVMPSSAIRQGEITWVDALSDRETMLIDGARYEADITSGGAADLPRFFQGKVTTLDYKTLRYPGHFAWVEEVVRGVEGRDARIAVLRERMLTEVPMVEDDFVIVYCSVTGKDKNGHLRKLEKAYRIDPVTLSGKRLRAIQATTAAPMAECVRILLQGKWQGVVKQSQIDPQSFLAGPFIEMVYHKNHRHNGVAVPI